MNDLDELDQAAMVAARSVAAVDAAARAGHNRVMPPSTTSVEQTLVDWLDLYLALLAERKLDQAGRFLAPGARLAFPGGKTFTSLEDQVAAGRGRYASIDKVRERWDVTIRPDGTAVVYSTGTLFGVNRHGVPFSGVRYVDRFELRDGLIELQEVWNDLGATDALERVGGM